MKIVIVIPTYNEKDNIGRVIDALSNEFPKDSSNEYQILVVEGNSPDGTADVVRDRMKARPFVHLLMENEKNGLGAAYVYGFKYAMEKLNPDVLVEMDADFQHDPKDITRLVAPISDGYDYVIGSRFTKGGSIPEEWALYRKFLSVGGNLFSKIVLGIYNVNDFTSGFKASRVQGFVDRLDLDNIRTKGFAYKIDLLFRMQRLGAKIKEIPISFGLRNRGTSKMERNNALDSLRVVLELRINENKNFFRFIVVGFIGLFVDTLFFNIFRIITNIPNTSALLSGGIAMITTFLLNNYWSFSERKIEGASKKVTSMLIYVISSSIPILVRSQLIYFAVKYFGNTFIVSNFAFFVGIIFGLIWNYLVYSKIIWKVKSNA